MPSLHALLSRAQRLIMTRYKRLYPTYAGLRLYPTYADLRLFCATPAQALTCEPEGHRLSLSITLSAEN